MGRSLLVFAGLAACGGPARPAAPPADLDHGTIVDHDDRCPNLPRACLEGFSAADDDGCPDRPLPEVVLPAGSTALPDASRRMLDELGREVPRLAGGAALILIVERPPGELDAEVARRAGLITGALAVGTERIRVEPVDGAAARIVIAVDGCVYGAGLPDTDRDGVPDHRDACPDEPEDLDAHLDLDGCPDADRACDPVAPGGHDDNCGDRDRDQVLDAEDRCPDEPGPRTNAGCPRPRAPPPAR